jgi:hypothetical protein
MKLYQKKFLGRSLQKHINQRTESQDAILWDVLSDQHLCRVKIQGSDELVTAHFPENWKKKPEYLKPGNAVRLTFVGGNRGRLEVSGFGRNIPSPVYGSVTPPITLGEDAVITGCDVVPTDPESMSIKVEPGTYRIAGTYYTLSGDYVLPETGGFLLPETGGMLLGDIAYIIEIDSPPDIPGYFRYDAISVGIDGVITYTKGEMSKWPDVPEIPNSHVLLGTILLYYGMTEITISDINQEFYTPVPTYIRAEFSSTDSYNLNDEITITVSILDQNENPIYKEGDGFKINAIMTSGTGELDPQLQSGFVNRLDGYNCYTRTKGYQYTGDSNHQVIWKYTRKPCSVDEADSLYYYEGDTEIDEGYYFEESVFFQFTCADTELTTPGYIFLFEPYDPTNIMPVNDDIGEETGIDDGSTGDNVGSPSTDYTNPPDGYPELKLKLKEWSEWPEANTGTINVIAMYEHYQADDDPDGSRFSIYIPAGTRSVNLTLGAWKSILTIISDIPEYSSLPPRKFYYGGNDSYKQLDILPGTIDTSGWTSGKWVKFEFSDGKVPILYYGFYRNIDTSHPYYLNDGVSLEKGSPPSGYTELSIYNNYPDVNQGEVAVTLYYLEFLDPITDGSKFSIFIPIGTRSIEFSINGSSESDLKFSLDDAPSSAIKSGSMTITELEQGDGVINIGGGGYKSYPIIDYKIDYKGWNAAGRWICCEFTNNAKPAAYNVKVKINTDYPSYKTFFENL